METSVKTRFAVTIELRKRKMTDRQKENLLDKFTDLDPSIGQSPFGYVTLTCTVSAGSLDKAARLAVQLVGSVPVSVSTMPSTDHAKRVGTASSLPPLLSIAEAAELLDISRQAAQQKVDSGEIPARRVGRAWVIPASAIDATAK